MSNTAEIIKLPKKYRKPTAGNLLDLIDGYLEGKVLRQAVMHRYFEYIYELHGWEMSPSLFEHYFSLPATPEGVDFIQAKLRRIGDKLERRRMRERLASARQRDKYFSRRLATDDGTITSESVIALLKAQDFKCAICGVYLTKDRHKQLDHIHPISKNGEHTLANVQWLCRTCNLKKNNKIGPGARAR